MLSLRRLSANQLRTYATTVGPSGLKDHYYLVVVGGGAGGLSVASKFTEVLTVLNKGKVAVVEPSDVCSPNCFLLSRTNGNSLSPYLRPITISRCGLWLAPA